MTSKLSSGFRSIENNILVLYLISGFSIFLALLSGEQAFNNIATDIILFAQVEQLADLGRPLRS